MEHSFKLNAMDQSSAEDINQDKAIKDFAKIIKRSQNDRNNENIRNIVCRLEDEIKSSNSYLIKMFLLNTYTGKMINSDNALNISFRVDTINMIFDSIYNSLISLGIDAEETAKVFYKSGYECGSNFGNHYNNFLKTRVDFADVSEKIEEWCDFDSSVGWGRLSYDKSQDVIIIKNNFQANEYANDTGFPSDCSFFKGYICGVLEKLIGRGTKVNIMCNKSSCKKVNYEGNCEFKIQRT